MKNLSVLILISLALAACSDGKKQEKDLLDNILKVHDKLMAKDEVLMKNKMQLDSMLKSPSADTAQKARMKTATSKLTNAEEAMENWMHDFEPDLTNKSHDEIMKYYTKQKKGILVVDSQMNIAIEESNKCLSNK